MAQLLASVSGPEALASDPAKMQAAGDATATLLAEYRAYATRLNDMLHSLRNHADTMKVRVCVPVPNCLLLQRSSYWGWRRSCNCVCSPACLSHRVR